jgi:hypothetical protein
MMAMASLAASPATSRSLERRIAFRPWRGWVDRLLESARPPFVIGE